MEALALMVVLEVMEVMEAEALEEGQQLVEQMEKGGAKGMATQIEVVVLGEAMLLGVLV
jgi:hypothetical protein